jgi:fibrillarin-like pre-rRNA processing protein
MVKARSMDVTAKPSELFKKVESEIIRGDMEVLENIQLKPYEKDHAALVARKR